jgi:predicted ATPase
MATIRTPDQKLRVFISSTMHELADERAMVRGAVEELHLIPVLFEMGARPHPPRELYRAYLEQSDIFIGIYGDQYGWIAPDSTISGIEDEYNLSSDMPRLIYVRQPAADRQPRLDVMLARIANDGISYRMYGDAAELRQLVADDLALLMSERFLPWRNEPAVREVKLRHELPSPTTRFIGREQQLLELEALVRNKDVRLLTLTGPGGIGKTRLAFALADSLKGRFEDGIAAVLLAPVRSADLVPTKIATSLGLPVTASRSTLEVLKEYLRERELLLVIDNFEHVIGSAPLVVDLLSECPRLRIIVTSREMLRVSAEQVYPVPPLQLAPSGGHRAEAVELFVERAIAIRRDLLLNDETIETISKICKRLDGLPLAIELAAARVRILSPNEILARLTNRLELLTKGPSDLPERQRTLRNTIEWSYDLLEAREQRLFECLSVFRGGFTLEAAEGVVHDRPDLLEGLASLLDKSLIRTDPNVSEPRFTMLETLREFAIEKLTEQADLEGLWRRHAEYFTDWVSKLETDTREAEAIHEMELDNDNLRAAMAWLIESGDPGRVARAAAVLWKFWWVRSLFHEGTEWMLRVKARPEPLSSFEDATAEFVIGILAFGNGDYPRAKKHLSLARTSYEELGDIRGAALTWICLGVAMRVEGDAEGEALVQRAVTTVRARGDSWATAFALFALGRVILMDGRADQAVPLLEESAERAVALTSHTLQAFALINLCWARLSLPDIDGAKEAAMHALEQSEQMDNRDGIARALEALAGVALAREEMMKAATLFGGAEAIRRSIGGAVWVPDRITHIALETSLRSGLGNEAFDTEFSRAAQLPVSDAAEVAHAYGAYEPTSL